MLELLNQLDGFASDDRIKVLAATNRVDVLDPALLRSGRLDRKIEFPLPNEEARAQILKIHSRKMRVDPAVNWDELARSTDEFGGAMLKAVCVEAGMIALRGGKEKIGHEHYVDAIAEVQAKKKDLIQDNWENYAVKPYNSWDADSLQSYLKAKGVETQKGAEATKDSLINQVQSSWYETGDQAQTAWTNVKDWIFDTWTDSELKEFADKHGIPVPQPRKRDSL
ncbi:hypothetical protein BN1708_016590, partial [Verticillium longisporum]